MSTGRTRPLLLGCESRSGDFFEVVVKLRGREMDEQAQAAELIAAQLAYDLGLQVPKHDADATGNVLAYVTRTRPFQVPFIRYALVWEQQHFVHIRFLEQPAVFKQ